MKKSERLRGRTAFREVLTKGEQVEAGLVRCFLLRKTKSNIDVQAGIIVSGRFLNAVQRNKVKRLLREAFSPHHELIAIAARNAGCSAHLVFVLKASKNLLVERMQLNHIQQDIAECCKALAARL